MTKSFSLLIALFALSLYAPTTSLAQVFQVVDLRNGDPVSFAKVIPGHEKGKIADIDGYFKLDSVPQKGRILVRAANYADSSFQLSDSSHLFHLRPLIQQIQEVEVRPGANPAERIMREAIKNRKANNVSENHAFQYESYSKLLLTIDDEALRKAHSDSLDSTMIEIKEFTDRMNLFQVESVAERKFKPPYRNKEVIKSYKVSGFSDPAFSTIFNEMQSYNFYENQFKLLGKPYINPLAFGGIRRYLFILRDTTINQRDTTYTIDFRPRKGKNFDGLSGQLFINTNGFAVEKVIAEPYQPDSSIMIKIIQEYEFLENKSWLPVKLSTEMKLHGLNISADSVQLDLIGKGNTYLHDIVLDPELKRRDFDKIDLQTEVGAGDRSEEEWDSLRLHPLSEKERNTYHIIDSVSKAENFEKYMRIIKILSTGKIPMNRFNLLLPYLYRYNEFEGHRLGLGLETSDKLMKRIQIGGYGAYGFKDKKFKYGGFAEFNVVPKKLILLNLNYHYDVSERGFSPYLINPYNLGSSDYMRQLATTNYDYEQRAQILIKAYLNPRIPIRLFGNYRRITTPDNYRFTPSDTSLALSGPSYDLAELGAEFSWRFQDRIIQMGYRRISTGSRFPLVNFQITKGIKNLFDSRYDYLRMNLRITHDIDFRGAGRLSWRLEGGYTDGQVPLQLLLGAPGTNSKLRVSVPNSFETMIPSRFYARKQAQLFTRYRLREWKTKVDFFQPQLSFHHAVGIADFQEINAHVIDIQMANKTYLEAGIILDKIYISQFSGLGVGVFSSYGHFSMPQFEKNLVYKLSFTFTL
ncbi:MAG: hypothetical protein EP338_02550 [Bacteroidetes bacterium]|nr:MAG: hypothetical protein EP338_02550 [Bacteroidota bacterium]